MLGHNPQQRQDKRLIVGVTGHIGAGKTSVAKYLSTAHGFYYIRYGQVLSEWRVKSPDDKKHLQEIGWEVMSGDMQAELNTRLIARIPPQSDCAVDGLRHPIDFDSLARSFAPHFYLFYIDCAPEIRWARLKQRFPHFEDFNRADSHPVEQQIESLRDKASKLVTNNGSLQNLYSEVEDLLEKMP